MKKAIFFAIVAAILLVPWAVAYGYDKVNAADISVNIEPADQSAVPTIHVWGNYTGNISNGDLFTIDTSGATTGTTFTLAISNVDALAGCYRCLSMNIGVYVQSGTEGWEKTAGTEMLVSMENNALTFSLPGNAKYKVTVESGSYHSFHITNGKNVAIPQFSMTAG
jgi:hypothetical protein